MGPAAGETAPRTGSVSGRYTFHLPNGWSRRPLEDDVQDGDEEGLDEQQGSDDHHRNGLYKPLLAQSDDRAEENDTLLEGQEADSTGSTSPRWDEDGIVSRLVRVGILCAFCIMGAAVLLPFNSLVTPSEYYRYLLADSPRAQGFMSWVVATFNVALIAAGALATISMHTSSPVRRIYYSAGAVFVSLLVLTLFTTNSNSDSDARGDQSASVSADLIFAALLALTLLIASATAYLQTAVVALCSVFGGRAVGLMLSGQGLVGLLVSVVQLVAAVSKTNGGTADDQGPEDHKQVSRAATVFFAFSTAFMAFAIATFTWLARLPLFRKTCRGMGVQSGSGDDAREDEDAQQTSPPPSATSTSASQDNFFTRRLAASNRPRARQILTIQNEIRSLSFAIFYTFTITLATFPALTARVISTDTSSNTTSWKRPLLFVAWHFVVFNGFDLTGRLLPSISPTLFLIRSARVQVVATLARTAFIPLLLACNVRSNHDHDDDKTAAGAAGAFGDATFFFLVASLALSNGLMSTGVMVSGPSDTQFTSDSDRATVGAIVNFWLGAGLAVGSFASFAVGAFA